MESQSPQTNFQKIQSTEEYNKKYESLEKQIRKNADNFFWIAGFSGLNSLIYLFGGKTIFIIGLGVNLILNVFIKEAARYGDQGMLVLCLLLNVGVIALFFAFGKLGRQKSKMGILAGIIIYALDGLVFLETKDWGSIAFHGFMLIGLFSGFLAVRSIEKMEESNRSSFYTSISKPLVVENPIQGLEEKDGISKITWGFLGLIVASIGLAVLFAYYYK